MMKKTILSARDLCKSFALGGVQSHVLQHMDLDIYEGDFTIIMGASGSGKSTLLYALSGMDRATAGQVLYNNLDIVAATEKALCELRHRDFGFIFQQMHLVSHLTLFENVAVPAYLNGEGSAGEIKERVETLLDRLGLAAVKDHLPSQVSGGEQQRCAIARAVINKPTLVFADEPTGALNRQNSTEVLDLLGDMNAAGQSILMVTHDLHAALRGNRLIYIDDGRVIGSLDLPPYDIQDEHSRQVQVNAWLASMKW